MFVDTGAFFAILDDSDHNHRAALAIMRRLATRPTQLITSNFVLAETHALTLARIGRSTALRFIDELDNSGTQVVRVTAADERAAREIIRRYDDKRFSFTDATSFSIMDRLRLDRAFAFDVNFRQYGKQVLQP